MTKKRKSKSKSTRKSMRKKLGAAPPNTKEQWMVNKRQLETVLELVKASDLKDIVTDLRTKQTVRITSTIWSKLSYFNAYSVTGEFGAHAEHMQTIDYMLKHSDYGHKKSNKDKWKKSINDAIYKGKYLDMFEHKKYNGPVIKQDPISKITLKDLTIILLENRLEIIDWCILDIEKRTTKKAEMPKAEQVPNAFNLERTPPNHWNDEIVRPIPDTFHT